jgi:hypothetical protein
MGANWLNRGGKSRVHTWSPQKLRSIHLIGVDDQAAPYPCWTKRVFACPNQRPATEALEAGIQAAGTHLMVDQSGVSRLGPTIHIWREWS